jgi:protein tyrosine phosphatase (PTP) superfamily phosphohydrolase (DUF442 family)
MTDDHVAEPISLAGIRNFGWVAPGLLARGEQPPLEDETFRVLYDLGIRSVVSLRPDHELPPANSRRDWPEYLVEDERRVVERAGLRFHHAPLLDLSAPRPDELAGALAVVDEAAAAQAVFAHCRAGAGRAALITGAWIVTRGRSGDDAATVYARFLRHLDARLALGPEDWHAYVRRVHRPQVWWALREIVAALGSPVTREYPTLPEPERPPEADDWPQTYREALRPWREQRQALTISSKEDPG